MIRYLLMLFLFTITLPGFAQFPLDSTRLPILYINTNWQGIPNEPKIKCDMLMLDNGYNQWNRITDTNYVYDSLVGLEKRGSISQLWPQNSYSLETWNPDSTSFNVSLLGMPKENDWVLYGPWDDHSLMRNVITYEIGRGMGYWAPRTKYVEYIEQVILPDYHGVYVLMEKIKRDNDRVAVSKLDLDDNAGDSLTGGYIIAVDKNIWTGDSGWTTNNAPNVFIKYVYPKYEDITPQQMNYIQQYVDSFESALLAPGWDNYNAGYRKYAEPNSFIDFFIISELSKNLDGYKRSGYLYKDKFSKGGKLKAGPFWDFNSAWNANLCGFDSIAGWAYPMTCWVNASFPVPFWWGRMLQDSIFTRDLKCRWITLRSSILDTANLFQKMDSIRNYISDAADRHYTRWNLAGTMQGDLDTLKTWIANRMLWMDANMPGNCWNLGIGVPPEESFHLSIAPNPFADALTLTVSSLVSTDATFTLVDALGRIMQSQKMKLEAGTSDLRISTTELSPGVYFATMVVNGMPVSKKIVKAGN